LCQCLSYELKAIGRMWNTNSKGENHMKTMEKEKDWITYRMAWNGGVMEWMMVVEGRGVWES